MPRSGRRVTLLFWLMALTGGAALAACLVLPAWLEHQATLQLHAQARQQVADLETRLQVVEKQIEHLRHDPAYVERLAHEEFGLTAPGVQTIVLDRADSLASQPTTANVAGPTPSPSDESKRGSSRLVGDVLERYPAASVFVLDETRPIVMALSATLLLGALLLLRTSGRVG
jgi:cell division protein FtsB